MSIIEAISAAAKKEIAKEFEKINEIREVKENKEVNPYQKIRHDIAYILENSYDVLISENEGAASEIPRDLLILRKRKSKRKQAGRMKSLTISAPWRNMRFIKTPV